MGKNALLLTLHSPGPESANTRRIATAKQVPSSPPLAPYATNRTDSYCRDRRETTWDFEMPNEPDNSESQGSGI